MHDSRTSRRTDALDRRTFFGAAAGGAASLAWMPGFGSVAAGQNPPALRRAYDGPNVVLIRFGGGARRREAIDPQHTYSPYVLNELAPRGVLFSNMHIDTAAPDTGHGQGTLNILTGKYDRYHDVENAFLSERFEAQAPTLFEYFRHAFDVPEHQTLIVNGEDRTQEEFYTFSNHHLFGANFRSNVLSLFRYKTYLLEQQLAVNAENYSGQQLAQKQRELREMKSLDYRRKDGSGQAPEIDDFWADWRRYYGDSGLVNPRGDRLLTELTIRALKQLQPKLVMVNYNDCDYVHWGNMSHYTRGIAIMDAGIRRIAETLQTLPAYRDNTVLVIVPDCGRDDSRLAAVPCQHHFNTRSSREIFALLAGPGVARGVVVDKPTEQAQIAATVGQLMGFATAHAEGPVLEEALS